MKSAELRGEEMRWDEMKREENLKEMKTKEMKFEETKESSLNERNSAQQPFQVIGLGNAKGKANLDEAKRRGQRKNKTNEMLFVRLPVLATERVVGGFMVERFGSNYRMQRLIFERNVRLIY